MVWADPAEPPVLLHPPLFPPPGMLSTMQAGEVAGGKRGQSGSNSQPGVTVTRTKPCEYVITLAVYIFAGSDPSGRGKRLLQRVKKLLSKMGPWDCCPKDHPRCTVKLALDINPIRVWTSGGMKPTPIQARFYNSNTERLANMRTDDGERRDFTTSDAFGLSRPDGSIEIPSIGLWAGEQLPSNMAGLNGLPEGEIPGTEYPSGRPNDIVVGLQPDPEGRQSHASQLIFAYDVLAIIIHEILHAMGAGHDDDDKTLNIMNVVWKMGKSAAFNITTKTACEIASKNRVCTPIVQLACCKPAHGAGNPQKPGLVATMDGFLIPGISVSGSTGNVGSAGYRSRWTVPFSQEGMGISTVPPSGMRGP